MTCAGAPFLRSKGGRRIGWVARCAGAPFLRSKGGRRIGWVARCFSRGGAESLGPRKHVRPPRYARSEGWGTGSAVCVLKIDWIKCRVTGPAAAPFPSNDPFHYRAGQLMTRIRLRPDVWLRTFVEMRVRLHRAHTHRFVRPMPFGPGSTSDLFVPDAILSR